MTRIIALMFLAVLLQGSAKAAEPQTSPGYAEGLTVAQAINVAAGLRQLFKYDAVDNDGKPTTRYFKFTSGNLRILIALDIDIAAKTEAAFERAKNEMITEMSNGGGTVPPEKLGQFNVAAAKMLDAPCRCALHKIKVADLNLEENPIPVTVLSVLIPILDR